ncbi:MAG: hypothetical protein PUD52_03980 [Prevotella sp.]|nr:hypothetical protein [Prevotella sp.]
MATFRSIKELTRALQQGSKLLSALVWTERSDVTQRHISQQKSAARLNTYLLWSKTIGTMCCGGVWVLPDGSGQSAC